MTPTDRISFRAIGRLAWEAFRRRWWLLPPLAGLQWLLSSAMDRTPDVLVAGWPGEAWAETVYTMVDDVGCGLISVVMVALALTGGRRAPLAAAETGRSLLAALPTILLVELVVSGPGWVTQLAFREPDDMPTAMVWAQSAAFLSWLALLLVALALFGATVPLAIAQRLSPMAAVKGAFRLTAGHRKRLLLMALTLGFIELVIVVSGWTAFIMAGQGEHWAAEGGIYMIEILDALVVAALYLGLTRLASSAPDRMAETFD